MSEQDDLQKKLIQLMDEALVKHDWSTSPYLRMVASKLKEYRDQLNDFRHQQDEGERQKVEDRERCPTGMKAIYVVLYSQEGTNLKQWEQMLLALTDNIFTRPLYADESFARQFVNSKISKQNYAYCKVYISTAEIIEDLYGQSHRDVLGNALLKLKNPSLKPEHIRVFYSQGLLYKYQNNKLILNQPSTPN